MKYPDSFEMKIIGAFGETGKAWLESLETLKLTYLNKWKLQSEGPVENLSYNYVLKVIDDKGKKAILKLGIPNYDFGNEVRTLQAYNGEGCAKIIKEDAENGAMLLERLLPGTMLIEVEEKLAVVYFAKVWTTIRRPVKKGADHPSIKHWMKALNRYQQKHLMNEGPIPTEFIRFAQACFDEITSSSNGSELLHGDLHHENILYSDTHGWIAIDPKGVVGDPYFDVVSFLTNQLFNKTNPKFLLKQRVKLLCEEMHLDEKRLLKAAIAMSTLYACWGIEDHDPDWKNTYQCARWFEELIEDVER